jgi:hypothetical protein
MALVLFHSGKGLPLYLEYTFKQIRLFNSKIIVYFLTDPRSLRSQVFKTYRIFPINKDAFYSDKIKEFELVYGRKSSDFWTITATRLMYLENFIQARKLKDVYYFENDVLLYYDLKELHNIFVSLYSNLSITTGGETKCMTGFLFIKNWKSLSLMTQFFIDVLTEYGKDLVVEHYGMEMLHEMSLMRAYGKEMGSSYLADLPTLPDSPDFKVFNSIFDPAAWGQYVGGTKNEGPGAKPLDHYVSRVLIDHPEYDVVWKKDEKGRKIPYFTGMEEDVRINNLHIHSKHLSKYVSK